MALGTRDNFTGNPSTLLESHAANSGDTWTQAPLFPTNSLKLESSGVLEVAANGGAYVSNRTLNNNQGCTIIFQILSNVPATSDIGAYLRASASDTIGYAVRYNYSNGSPVIDCYSTPSFTQISSTALSALTTGTHIMRINVSDVSSVPLFTVWIDDVIVAQFKDTGGSSI